MASKGPSGHCLHTRRQIILRGILENRFTHFDNFRLFLSLFCFVFEKLFFDDEQLLNFFFDIGKTSGTLSFYYDDDYCYCFCYCYSYCYYIVSMLKFIESFHKKKIYKNVFFCCWIFLILLICSLAIKKFSEISVHLR